MNISKNEQYLSIFIDESKENLQKLNQELLVLEKTPDNKEVINEIFRVAHTLKGMSQTMGYMNIGNLTHNMENALDMIRSGKTGIDENIINTLFRCLDLLGNLVQSLEESGGDDITSNESQMLVQNLIKELESIALGESTENNNVKSPQLETSSEPQSLNTLKPLQFSEEEITTLKEAVKDGYLCKNIKITIADECLLPAVRAYMAYQVLDEFGGIVKTLPSAMDIEQGEVGKEFFAAIITEFHDDEIRKKILNISEIASVEISDIPDTSEIALRSSNSESVSESKEIEQTQNNKDEKDYNGNKENKPIAGTSLKTASQTIRINADRIDKLMNIVGELVTSKSQLVQISDEFEDTNLTGCANFISSITSELQEIVINLRMLPIENVFNRFPRLVRDISKNLGKTVELQMVGQETEIDRAIIDEISDPLVHIIKNSLDHGIEIPEERIQKGKPTSGLICMTASNEGDSIKIVIQDDGKGIDTEKVKNIALQKGLISQEEAKRMSPKEAMELLFRAGFSTSEKTTDLSGRGVGMDVVKSKIFELGGNVGITSEIDKGTVITVNIPSTMAITQALIIKVAKQTYAVPLNYISESVEIPINDIKTVKSKEVILLRDETIPILRLDRILQTDCDEAYNDKATTARVLIANSNSNLIGLVVSEVVNQHEIVMKPLADFMGVDKIISGATILGNGKVALILNINSLYDEMKNNRANRSLVYA